MDPSQINAGEILRERGRIYIASTRPEIWQPFLENSDAESIVFFFLGNELYKIDQLTYLSTSKALKALFLYSPRISPSIKNLLSSLVGATFDSCNSKLEDLRTYLRNFRTGYEVLRKLNRNKGLYKKVIEIPQGYSSAFVTQLKSLIPSLQPRQSIIDNIALVDSICSKQSFIYDFSFVGQSGSLRRQRFLELVARVSGSRSSIAIRKEFGGNKKDVDGLYLDLSLKSRCVLVPPGVFNNYNHRYCESLIMGRLPIVVCNNQTDPNSNYYWVNQYPIFLRDSVRYILRKVKFMNDPEILRQIDLARRTEFKKIIDFRNRVHNLVRLAP